jgi:hypothetical protein
VKKYLLLFALAGLPFTGQQLMAQTSGSNKVVNYKSVSDEPYGINKMWLHFQPIVADVFMTNFSVGFGAQYNYLFTDKVNFEARMNTSYTRSFDFARDLAQKNAGIQVNNEDLAISNRFAPYLNLQVGGSYHIIDNELKGTSKIMLTSKKVKTMQLTSVDYVTVNSKVRQIVGIRGGGYYMQTTTNLGTAMIKQGRVMTGSDGSVLVPGGRNAIYSSLMAPGFYLGGSFGQIRNVAIKADKFGVLGNNTIFTSYADLMYSPFLRIDDVLIQEPGTENTITYTADNLKLNRVGWRAGFDIMYNQDKYFSFGGEIGARPTLAGRGMYAMAKVGFPVFSFKPKQARTANNTGSL